MGRGLIPGPIWKMPCNDLFITYFQAEEIRIYAKHNFNMNIFNGSLGLIPGPIWKMPCNNL
jgi:hypothetical protein